MSIRVNPKLIDDLGRYGAEDVQMCYHCGDCSAMCPHSNETYVFPRKSMRWLQMGLEKKLESSLEPWLCYYCGQCSEQCPRGAEPGESMMSIRRWLISRYDITGVARFLFRSKKSEIISIILIALLTGAGFFFWNFPNRDLTVYDGSGAFLPSSFMHKFDLILAACILSIIIINAFRMWWFTLGRDSGIKIPVWLYFRYVHLLPWHFFTQKRYADCEAKKSPWLNMPWLTHLGLMLGYTTMLFLVMAFIKKLQYGPEIDWSVHTFGYLASFGLITGIIYFTRHRLKKTKVQYKKSHGSDWIFIMLLLLVAVTGIIQHILHRSGILVAANVFYVIHLMFVLPWLLTMPFSKIMHMFYRPMAMYFADVRMEALAIQEKQKVLESEPKYVI